jgi:hypothetical protein
MEPDLKWIIGSIIEQVEYDDQTQRWIFTVAGRSILYVNCPWKLISAATVSLASGDHGQQYGLAHPIDVAVKAMDFLAGRKIKSIVSDKVTSDLTINFEGDVILCTFSDSSGFEAWQLIGPQGAEFIAQGNGNIVVLSQEKKS